MSPTPNTHTIIKQFARVVIQNNNLRKVSPIKSVNVSHLLGYYYRYFEGLMYGALFKLPESSNLLMTLPKVAKKKGAKYTFVW